MHFRGIVSQLSEKGEPEDWGFLKGANSILVIEDENEDE
jgi:hypothetical protein